MSLFCRHNRFTAECPICSKGTVLDPNRSQRRSRPASPRTATPGRRGRRPAPPPGAARITRGPYASAGPYLREGDGEWEVRLEKVPGGVRLGSWSGGSLERCAPVLDADDLAALVLEVAERELLPAPDRAKLLRALEAEPAPQDGDPPFGSSEGRSGELRDELRVEPFGDDRVRIGRWIHRPGTGEWELQDAPPMLPAARFAEALESAVRRGILAAT